MVPALPVASVNELIFIGMEEPSMASSAGLDIEYVAVKLVVEFLVTVAVLPLTVIVGSVPVLIASSEVRVNVITSFTIAKVASLELFDAMVTAVKEGACLSKVTPPSESFATAVTCAPTLFAISEKSTVNATTPVLSLLCIA